MMGGFGRIAAGSVAMVNFASMLAGILNRPVYDRTNLTGNFDIQIEYTPDQMPQIPPGATLPPGLTLPSSDGPSLNTALQEQLGLKLDATRGPVDVLVIDSVEQPYARLRRLAIPPVTRSPPPLDIIGATPVPPRRLTPRFMTGDRP